MAALNNGLTDGALAVARVVARQVSSDPVSTATTAASSITSAISSATETALSTAISSITSAASSPPVSSPTTTSSDPTSTSNPGSSQQSGGGSSSPLLFFVALGFGVVFTNLWIIVGVKYCFRYNARNRQMRGLDENGDPINLENMPTRPHRRRREKKLMTMDEVNEKFPMMKYKTWVAGRAKEGLPTAGGVSAPPSRANSVRSVEGIVPEVPAKVRDSIDDTGFAAKKITHESADGVTTNDSESDNTLTQTQTAGSIITKDPDQAHASDDEDDDDHINAAVPPELLATSGDTCAICIDTLEDDDDVRGLTCGHAFHAVCLDPWLTNRRACCPLCKADYYTPKPRPPPADADPNNPTAQGAGDVSRNNGRMNMPRQPQRTLGINLRDGPRNIFSRYGNSTNVDSHGRPRRSDRDRRRTGNSRTTSRANSRAARTTAAPTPTQSQAQLGGFLSRIRSRIPTFRQNANSAGLSASGVGSAETTPSQLEAGTRTTS